VGMSWYFEKIDDKAEGSSAAQIRPLPAPEMDVAARVD
jgi:hypothetical protein